MVSKLKSFLLFRWFCSENILVFQKYGHDFTRLNCLIDLLFIVNRKCESKREEQQQQEQ